MAEDDATGVAQFIFNNPDLSKDKTGEYFGRDKPFNIEVLSIYTDLLNFKD